MPGTADVGAGGTFEPGPLPAGRYRVRVSTRVHGQRALVEFPLATGEDQVELQLGTTVRGELRVRDPLAATRRSAGSRATSPAALAPPTAPMTP